PLLNRSWSSTIRTRRSSTAVSSAITASLILGASGVRGGVRWILVNRDRHRAAAPGPRLGERREPEVDRRPPDRAADVRRDSLAVARDAQARPERDHRR